MRLCAWRIASAVVLMCVTTIDSVASSCDLEKPGPVQEHSFCDNSSALGIDFCVGRCQTRSTNFQELNYSVLFRCSNGTWKVDDRADALICSDEHGADIWLKNGVYYQMLRDWWPFGRALETASQTSYGGISGHMATPLDAIEQSVLVAMLRSDLYYRSDVYVWIGLRNTNDILRRDRHLLQPFSTSLNYFREPATTLFFTPDVPEWKWVTGPERGKTVWRGTSPTCTAYHDGPRQCGGISEGHAENNMYSDWSAGFPNVMRSCVVTTADAWESRACSDNTAGYNITYLSSAKMDATYRTVVQFRADFEAKAVKTAYNACGEICECSKTANQLVPEPTFNLTAQLYINIRSYFSFDNSNLFGAGLVSCTRLFLTRVPTIEASPRFENAFIDRNLGDDGVDDRLRVNINTNNITQVAPAHFAHLPYLLYLDLSYNQFTVAPRIQSESLEILLLNSNFITLVEKGIFDGLPELRHINLLRNSQELKFSQTELGREGGVFYQTTNPKMNRADTDSGILVLASGAPTLTPTAFPTSVIISTVRSATSANTFVITISFAMVVCVVCIIAVVFTIRWRRYRKITKIKFHKLDIQKSILSKSEELFSQLYGSTLGLDRSVALDNDFKSLLITDHTSTLAHQKKLTAGVFGFVYVADLTSERNPSTQRIALKCCKSGDAAGNVRLLIEARLLLSLDHYAIVKPLAIHVDSLRPWFATPYFHRGDLQMVLRQSRRDQLNSSDYVCPLSEGVLLNILARVCDALAYIGRQLVVHADVAARNVLIGHDMNEAYLHDFGSALPARAMNVTTTNNNNTTTDNNTDNNNNNNNNSCNNNNNGNNTFNNNINNNNGNTLTTLGDSKFAAADVAVPFRWMAPESLLHSIFTPKSDVYSFGVLVWECCTQGKTPYGALGHHEVQELLIAEERLVLPKTSLVRGVDVIMQQCWNETPSKRPHFSDLLSQIRQIIANNTDNTQSRVTSPNTGSTHVRAHATLNRASGPTPSSTKQTTGSILALNPTFDVGGVHTRTTTPTPSATPTTQVIYASNSDHTIDTDLEESTF